MAEPLRLMDLAAGTHLSSSRFAHLFRDETGCAPGEFLLALRMHRARVLLERTFLSIKEVMALVGCNDASHFARDFRRHHGMAPSAWRATRVSPDASHPQTSSGNWPAASAKEQQDRPSKRSSRQSTLDVIVNSVLDECGKER